MLTGIASLLLTTAAAIYTGLILPLLQQYLQARIDRHTKDMDEAQAHRKKVALTYLNPLRLWAEETYVRLSEISVRLRRSGDRLPALTYVTHPKTVSQKDADWFNGKGCYLISTCYITACLFATIQQVRENMPYLSFSKESDTELMTLMFYVSHGFLQDLGVFYVTQPSIGQRLYLPDQSRLMTYREFCLLLQDPEERIWCDRLINFYIETGQGQKLHRIEAAIVAIANLSQFLDTHIGQGVSLQERLNAEMKPGNGQAGPSLGNVQGH